MADKPSTDQEKVPKWAWQILIISSITVTLLILYLNYRTKDFATASYPRQTYQIEKFVIAYPGRWTDNVNFDPDSSHRIIPENWVWIKTWDGRVYADGPGQAKWLGDNIPDANMRFASAMRTPVRVRILTQPK